MAVGRYSSGLILAIKGGMSRLITLACAGVFLSTAPLFAARVLTFEDLQGWAQDDHAAALEVFRTTCGRLDQVTWDRLCQMAQKDIPARGFFELFFRPVALEGSEEVLFTGYFEPILHGSPVPTGKYRTPVYRRPDGFESGSADITRRAIVERGVLRGKGLEIAYVDSEVDLFFAQIQGSATIQMTNGRRIRISYGGHNGHPYSSVGQWLIDRGYIEAHQASARFLKNWARNNQRVAHQAMMSSHGYVFFEEKKISHNDGPRGALLSSLTGLRSIAVDPDVYPLGGVYWIAKDGKDPIDRLVVAQDTGSRIKTRGRIDIFFGTGDQAGRDAGRVRDQGQVYTLMPIDMAYAVMREAQER